MQTLFRWLVRLAFGLVALAAAAAALVWYLVSGSLPDYEGKYRVAGIAGTVEIVRDLHAVPHIFAGSREDALFALGLVHAQDRLWQMEIARRTAQGRLSELFGTRSLDIDILMRALDLYPLAAEAVRHQSDETRAGLEAYARGVNAWIDIVGREARGRGAPEFLLFAREIAPWTPADSIAMTKLMALRLTDMAQRETARAALAQVLPPARLRDILPDSPDAAILSLPDFAALAPRAPSPLLDLDLAGASNAFAALGTRTASGLPILATDPHLGLSAPAIWTLARLSYPGTDAIGATIPGIPAIVIGRNAAFGWGLTTAYIDDQDVYVEQLNPDRPGEYRTPEGWAPFRTRESRIEVDGTEARTVTLRWTRHGPVIPPGFFFGPGDLAPQGYVLALAWTALTAEDRSIESLMGLASARSVAEARGVLALAVAPGQNVIMADAATVALQVAGRVPLRRTTHQGEGRVPAPGWVAENDWEGFLPFAELPFVANPEGGVVVNTNNRTADAPFPRHISFDWGDSQRIRRARRLLEAREFHSRDSFVEIQTDIVSETARTLLPLMARDLWWAGQPRPEDEAGRARQQALERLAEWNGEMNEHAPEPLVYVAWARALQRRLALDELGPAFEALRGFEPVFIERVLRDVDGAGVWCDIRATGPAETCAEIARLALDDALAGLAADFGPRMESWRWGDAHVALQRHQVLGEVFPFSLLVNIEQPTSGGDFTLMRGQMRHRGPLPFANVHASGFRAVYDFADPNGSLYIVSTGISGHPFSRHYDDLSELWRRGEYIRMTLDPEAARGGAIGTTWLAPANPGE